MTNANPNFRATVAQFTRAIQNLGSSAAASAQSALGQTYQTLIAQAGLLAYKDVFLYCALVAFAFVPFTFFFSPVKKAGGPGAAH
jgi:DHA2 family multidrug resistance protein